MSERSGKFTDVSSYNKANHQMANKVIDELVAEYGMKYSIFDILAKRVSFCKMDAEEISYVTNLIARILKAYGLNEEEITNFFNSNRRLFTFKSASDFRARVAILNHFGFLKEALLNGYYYCFLEFLKGFSIRKFYAVLCEYNEENISGLSSFVYNLSESDMNMLVRKHYIDNDLLKKIFREFDIHLIEEKRQNAPIKKLD